MKPVDHHLRPLTDYSPTAQGYVQVAVVCEGCEQQFPTDTDPGWDASCCLGLAQVLASWRTQHHTGDHLRHLHRALGIDPLDPLGHPDPALPASVPADRGPDFAAAVKIMRACPECHPQWLAIGHQVVSFLGGRLRVS